MTHLTLRLSNPPCVFVFVFIEVPGFGRRPRGGRDRRHTLWTRPCVGTFERLFVLGSGVGFPGSLIVLTIAPTTCANGQSRCDMVACGLHGLGKHGGRLRCPARRPVSHTAVLSVVVLRSVGVDGPERASRGRNAALYFVFFLLFFDWTRWRRSAYQVLTGRFVWSLFVLRVPLGPAGSPLRWR